MNAEIAPAPEETKSLWESQQLHVVVAVSVFLMDAVLFHGFLPATVTLLLAIFWFTPAALFAPKDRRQIKVLRLLIYLLTVAAILAVQWANNHMAERNSIRLIAAVYKFKTEHRSYPRSLGQLVPGYLAAVPRSHFTVFNGHFSYENLTLLYWHSWPSTMLCYGFESKIWRVYDTLD